MGVSVATPIALSLPGSAGSLGSAVSALDDRFPPIGSYGFLSDCHTAALISFAGSVEWLCLPRFDSPSAFAALLDRGAGHFTLKPRDVVVPISRRYEPGTLVIETTWVTDTGWAVIHDALTIADWATADGKRGRPETAHESDRSLLRTMTCIDGEVEMEMECLPRFAYGLEGASWSGGELGEAVARTADGTELRLTSDMELTIEDGAARGTLRLRENESGFCAVSWGDGELGGTRSSPEALERLDSTEEFWREWLRDGEFPDHPWRIHLQRSALVLKGLTYTPPGRSWRRRPPRCRRPPAANATGTTASAGSATRPSASGPCTRSASTRRRATSCASSSKSVATTPIFRSCTGSAARSSSTRRPWTTSAATAARRRCGSATAPSTSARTTSGGRCSTRSTCTRRP